MQFEPLIRDLVGLDRMLWVIGGGEVVSENAGIGMKDPKFDTDYVTVESDSWHLHLKISSVSGVQFVEAEDHGIPYLYYVRFSDEKEETMLRVYFPNPYLDENDQPAEFQPEKLQIFEGFRDRHVGHDGIIFVRRPRQH